MIPFPSYIRVGGHVVRVKQVVGLLDKEDAFGTFDDGKLEIRIDASLCKTPSLFWDTFWHEVCECLTTVTDSGTQISHQTIQTYGLLLAQVFQSLLEKGQRDG